MITEYRKNIVQLAEMYVGTEVPNGDDKFIKFYNELTGAGFSVNGTAWCAIFVTYCARHVGIPTSVIPNFASCTTSRDSFWKPNTRWKSRTEYTPEAGDIIYFDWDLSGNCDHVGIVKDVDDNYIYTIEGNTSSASGVVSNGGGVAKKKYKLTASYIAGYGRPNWDIVKEEDEMTQDQFNEMFKVAMADYEAEKEDNTAAEWSADAREWATGAAGLINGVGTMEDGSPNYAWPRSVTRQELVTVLYRAKENKVFVD